MSGRANHQTLSQMSSMLVERPYRVGPKNCTMYYYYILFQKSVRSVRESFDKLMIVSPNDGEPLGPELGVEGRVEP